MLSWQAKFSRVIGPLVMLYFFCKLLLKVKFGKNDWLYYLRQEIESVANPPKEAITQQVTTEKIKGLMVSHKQEKSRNIILFLHGGAYLIGTPRFYTELAYYLSQATDRNIFVLDYRLAPESTFPSPVEDAVNAYHYLLETGYAPENIIIAGDSAGGGLTVATLISLREEKTPLPKCAICIAPFFDFTFSGASIQYNSKKDYLLRITDAAKKDLVKMVLDKIDPKNPLVSPLYGDLSGLPPMLIQVGSYDVLLDDSLRFTEKAKQSNMQITLKVWPEMPHDWPMLARFLPEGKQAIQEIGDYIRSID